MNQIVDLNYPEMQIKKLINQNKIQGFILSFIDKKRINSIWNHERKTEWEMAVCDGHQKGKNMLILFFSILYRLNIVIR